MNSIFTTLPEELEYELLEYYVPKEWIYLVDKNRYETFRKGKHIEYDNVTNITRYLIRHDYDYLFSFVLRDNIDKWIKIKKYLYNTTIFRNYSEFLLAYCLENNANKCKDEIYKIFNIKGLSKNRHKKKHSKSIIPINIKYDKF